MWKKTKGNVAFSSAFYDQVIEQYAKCACLNLDKKYRKIFFRAKQLPIKGLIDNRCNALEAVPERRAQHVLNAHFFHRVLRMNVNIKEMIYELAWYIAVITSGLEFRCVGIKPQGRKPGWFDNNFGTVFIHAIYHSKYIFSILS